MILTPHRQAPAGALHPRRWPGCRSAGSAGPDLPDPDRENRRAVSRRWKHHILARQLANTLQQKWGQTVIVDNKGGASGTIFSEQLTHMPADGYTLMLTATHHVILIRDCTRT